MVAVSDNFKKLALSAGRRVYCRIIADGEEFLDDRLLEFDFDDVTHPDWFTVGTACANRFHFSAEFNGVLSVNGRVMPYISFDGTEWCPLGVFYISRRYQRRGIISVTCYDRMYSLDMELKYKGDFPISSDKLLGDICAEHGIELSGAGMAFEIQQLPEVCTVRDMIGYIAGLNRACAKFDRYGRLVMKQCSAPSGGDMLSHLNCIDIRRNMESSVVTCIKAETETESLVSGDGAEISTIEMYNPFMTQERLDSMCAALKGFEFYGADIEMQGIPFLESGESIMLRDRDEVYPIVISEIEYIYDGGLTAMLYSRNKANIDAIVHEDDLEESLKKLEAKLIAVPIVQTNAEDIDINAQELVIADISFKAGRYAFAQLDLNAVVSAKQTAALELSVNINGKDSGRRILHSHSGAGDELLLLHHTEVQLPVGDNRIYVTAKAVSGTAVISAEAMQTALVIHGGQGTVAGGVRDKLSLYEELPFISAERYVAGLADITAVPVTV
ncbi:MAG: hypothetical protein IJZ95_08200 [Oscillospiraceae bacterium]|nr:hypothetical protein [Oscillospiraceae bacterium]